MVGVSQPADHYGGPLEAFPSPEPFLPSHWRLASHLAGQHQKVNGPFPVSSSWPCSTRQVDILALLTNEAHCLIIANHEPLHKRVLRADVVDRLRQTPDTSERWREAPRADISAWKRNPCVGAQRLTCRNMDLVRGTAGRSTLSSRYGMGYAVAVWFGHSTVACPNATCEQQQAVTGSATQSPRWL